MASVTQRIKEAKQPYGGYIKPSELKKIEFDDGNELGEESIHSSLVGLTVDYMTRYIMGTPKEKAFEISLMGSRIIDDSKYASTLLQSINGLNNKSIYNACKLVGYDVCFRAGPMAYKDVRMIEADEKTINNIEIMVNRSITFFEKYGPIIQDGFTFEGGYTNTIDSGDGDFLTEDTLWDFKVSSSNPTSKHTLQLLVYYIMGKNSIHSTFVNIKRIGIFNPRLNCVFLKEISEIPEDIIKTVSKEVIGYSNRSKKVVSSEELTVSDLMRELQCTRYMVMKYYSEEGLPLRKVNNKYYISKTELFQWITLREEESERRERILLITLLICCPIACILTVFLLFNVFKF